MYYFIVNLHGGSGKAQRTWDAVEATLHANHIAYKTANTENDNGASSLARRILSLERGIINLVIVGGDGTINEVLNGIAREDFARVRFGVIPTGSGNDFARGAGIPCNAPEQALMRILNAAGGRSLDLGMVTMPDVNRRRVFAISSGMGLDAIVGVKASTTKLKKVLNRLHLGKFTYIIYTVQTLFTLPSGHYQVTFDDGETHDFTKLIFLACMNFRAEGGGVPMAPEARADDGKLSVCLAAGISPFMAFIKFPLLVAGKHGKLRGFLIKNCTSLDITGENATTVHTDGEFAGKVRRAHFECLPGALQMLL